MTAKVIDFPRQKIDRDVYIFDKYMEDEDLHGIINWCINHKYQKVSGPVAVRIIAGYSLCIQKGYGTEKAAAELGKIYYDGVLCEQNFENAVNMYIIGIKEGSIEAVRGMGYCFFYGKHVDQNYEAAFKLFSEGSLVDDACSIYMLAEMYRNGLFVRQDYDMAFILYTKAGVRLTEEDDIHPEIDMRIGECAMNGIGTEREPEKAIYLLCKAYADFYKKREYDPKARDGVLECRKLIAECISKLEGKA